MSVRELLIRRVGEEPRQQSMNVAIARIGRAPECDVLLASPFVSRHHATLNLEAAPLLVDEGSQNGVYVNGQRISGAHPLKIGDEIVIADFEITFLEYDSSGPTMEYGDVTRQGLRVDEATRQVYLGPHLLDIDLSSQEFDLLALLVAADGAVCSHEGVGNAIWGTNDASGRQLPNYDRNMVHQLASRLKTKLSKALGEPAPITNVRGHGYRLSEAQPQ